MRPIFLLAQAKEGDGFVVKYFEKDGTKRVMVVDGGPWKSLSDPFKLSYLKTVVDAAAWKGDKTIGAVTKAREIDQVVLSHRHTDHYMGLVQLFHAMTNEQAAWTKAVDKTTVVNLPICVQDVWDNFASLFPANNGFADGLEAIWRDHIKWWDSSKTGDALKANKTVDHNKLLAGSVLKGAGKDCFSMLSPSNTWALWAPVQLVKGSDGTAAPKAGKITPPNGFLINALRGYVDAYRGGTTGRAARAKKNSFDPIGSKPSEPVKSFDFNDKKRDAETYISLYILQNVIYDYDSVKAKIQDVYSGDKQARQWLAALTDETNKDIKEEDRENAKAILESGQPTIAAVASASDTSKVITKDVFSIGTGAPIHTRKRWGRYRDNAADDSLENKSSFIFTVNDPSNGDKPEFLLTGDTVGKYFATEIEFKNRVQTAFGKAIQPVELFKVPHHGSAKNNDAEFTKMFPARIYVFSSALTPHSHPDIEVVIGILKTAQTTYATDNVKDGKALPLEIIFSNDTVDIDWIFIFNNVDPYVKSPPQPTDKTWYRLWVLDYVNARANVEIDLNRTDESIINYGYSQSGAIEIKPSGTTLVRNPSTG